MNESYTPEQRTKYVRLTNGLDMDFTDRYNGVPVCVEPGKSENFPIEMAAHFFGYHEGANIADMYRHIAKRQGWNTPEFTEIDRITRKNKAQQYCEKLKIEAVMYKMVEVKAGDPSEPIPADPQPPRPSAPGTPRRVELRA